VPPNIQGFHKRILELKASTEANLVREEEQNICYFTGKTQESHMGWMTTRHSALFFVHKHYQQRSTAPTIVKINTHKLWPWASIRWGVAVCEKDIWVMESNVATFNDLYRTIPVLLPFNILPLLYEDPVFYILYTSLCDLLTVHITNFIIDGFSEFRVTTWHWQGTKILTFTIRLIDGSYSVWFSLFLYVYSA